MFECDILVNSKAGPFVQWYNPDTDQIAVWYGSYKDCLLMAQGDPPGNLEWHAVSHEKVSDAATATGMYDYE